MTLTASSSVTPSPDFTHRLLRWSTRVHAGSLTQEHVSPRNQEAIAALPACTSEDVVAAFTQARSAQHEWARTPLKQRTAIVSRFHDLVLEHHELLLDVVQHETGKSRASAFEEVADIGLTAQYYAASARRHLKPAKRQGAFPLLTRTREYCWPKGVVGMITPWNYPLTLPITDAQPALLAGNAIVLKPDAQTPLSSLAAIDLLYQAGLPEGLFQVVLGDGPTVGGAIIDNADVVMFTGSTATGKKVAQACGERLIGFSAELGGKNPMIVLDDAPLERALQGTIPAAFSNTGQLCVAIERLYVHDAIYDTFVPELTKAVSELTLGTDLDYSYDIGSLISQDQLDKVTGHVEDAIARGAKVLTGGSARPDIAALHHGLRDKPYQANRVLGVLSKMFNLAEVWGLRPDGSNPTRHVQKYKEHKRERYLDPDEIETLWRVLDQAVIDGTETEHVTAAFKLLLLTGCRLSEIQKSKWSWIRGNILLLPDAKTGPRRVMLSKSALDVLAAVPRLPNNPHIIAGKVEGQYATDMQKPWRRIRKGAKLDDVRIHDLRHTYASLAAAAGHSLPIIGKLLGHTQAQTTARYAHLADSVTRSAADDVDGLISGFTGKPAAAAAAPALAGGRPPLRLVTDE